MKVKEKARTRNKIMKMTHRCEEMDTHDVNMKGQC